MRGSDSACFFLSPTLKGGKKPGYDLYSVLCVVGLKTEDYVFISYLFFFFLIKKRNKKNQASLAQA